MKPAEMNPEVVYHTVITNVLRHLHQAGISLAYEKHDIFYAEMPPRQLDRMNDRAALVQRIEIFSGLQQEETARLAARIKERRFGSGSAIVNQGDPGDSMFVLVEGLLEVRSDLENGRKQVRVKSLEPGEFFGEMSLLTGEPRAATVAALTDTVVYEIGKEDLESLLAHRPEIAVNISQIVAQRRHDLAALEKLTPEEKAVAQHSFAEQILDKMKSVFSSLRHGLGLRPRETAIVK
jgi:CRP-like cAMP-binding protein